jgi:serine/threonine-protein kinase
VALGVLLIGGLVAWWFLAGPGSPTVVPQTTRLTYARALARLEQAHLGANRIDSFDETVPKGVVLSTDPGAGKQVPRGTDVKVTVSKGPERYAVPSVLNKSQAEATDEITAAKLAVGKVSQDFSDTVTQGLVISVDPAPGTPLKRGARVDLLVSKGPQPIAVTDFTGQPAAQAVDALTKAGLQVDATQQENSDTVPKGNVIRQSPSGGTLFKGQQVTLVVSKGPVMVTVPDVQGRQEADATKVLTAAGFKVSVQRFMGGIFGTVRSQDPAAGTQQPKGSTITLVVV